MPITRKPHHKFNRQNNAHPTEEAQVENATVKPDPENPKQPAVKSKPKTDDTSVASVQKPDACTVEAVPGQSLLTPSEAGGYLKIAEATLEKWRAKGVGPDFLRIAGRSIRYRQSDLDRYIESCTISAADSVI